MISGVTIVGANDLARKLEILKDSMYDFSDAYEDIGEFWRDQVDMQFALRGAVPGVRGPWKPLSPNTIARKHGRGSVLVDIGNMELSYINTYEPYNVDKVGTQSASFGSSYKARSGRSLRLKPIARYHQEGTRFMPARPIVLGNKFLDEEIVDSFTDHMFRGWGL